MRGVGRSQTYTFLRASPGSIKLPRLQHRLERRKGAEVDQNKLAEIGETEQQRVKTSSRKQIQLEQSAACFLGENYGSPTA